VQHVLAHLPRTHDPDQSSIRRFAAILTDAIRPYNSVGLCHPESLNMYRYTAAPEKTPGTLGQT